MSSQIFISRVQNAKAAALLSNRKTVREALASPELRQCIDAIHAEMASLIITHPRAKGTFEIVPTPAGCTVIPTKILTKIVL